MAANGKIVALQIKIASTWTTVAEAGSASITITRGVTDFTPFINDAQRFIAGTTSASVSAELYFDVTVNSHVAFENAVNLGGLVELRFVLNYPPSTTRIYEGEAIIREFTVTGRAGDLVRAQMNAQFSEPISIS